MIHLDLWDDGYSDISTIGPLFLAQGIGSIVLALAIVALRRLALLVVGAIAAFALLLATAQLALSPLARTAGSPRRAYPQAARFRVLAR